MDTFFTLSLKELPLDLTQVQDKMNNWLNIILSLGKVQALYLLTAPFVAYPFDSCGQMVVSDKPAGKIHLQGSAMSGSFITLWNIAPKMYYISYLKRSYIIFEVICQI
jgi:hypothetical protein